MRIIKNLADWQRIRRHIHPKDHRIGFVPTMGCLHQGHASLIKHSLKQNSITVVSLFVNPTQFNQQSDYENYPNTLDSDCDMANKLGVNYLLIPDKQAMYPDGNDVSLAVTHEFANTLEGEHRTNHFNGVLTIVMKLLNLVRPQYLYMGEKDFQQYILLDYMVKNYFMPTEVVMCPTIREDSGLALSSRNNRLSAQEKTLAHQFAQLLQQCSPNSLEQTKKALQAAGIKLEYLKIHNNRLFAAAYIGDIRLIDNFALTEE